jgi:hypothetical protein
MTMSLTALVTWVLTAGGGFVMLGIWLSRGGARRPGASRFPPTLVFGHTALAAVGLVLWIAAIVTGGRSVAWAAVMLAALAAMLGFGLLLHWIPVRRGDGGDPAESHFPLGVVIAHGVFAVATVVLVLLTALTAQAGGV